MIRDRYDSIEISVLNEGVGVWNRSVCLDNYNVIVVGLL